MSIGDHHRRGLKEKQSQTLEPGYSNGKYFKGIGDKMVMHRGELVRDRVNMRMQGCFFKAFSYKVN